jgi:hypothetical protein
VRACAARPPTRRRRSAPATPQPSESCADVAACAPCRPPPPALSESSAAADRAMLDGRSACCCAALRWPYARTADRTRGAAEPTFSFSSVLKFSSASSRCRTISRPRSNAAAAPFAIPTALDAPMQFIARRRRHLHARALLVEVALLVGTLPPDLQPAHVGAGTGPTPPTSAPGLGSPPPTSALGQWDWAHPTHVGAGTRLTPGTSAPGLHGLTPAHICAGTGLTPADVCSGTGLTPGTSAPGLHGLTPAHICRGRGGGGAPASRARPWRPPRGPAGLSPPRRRRRGPSQSCSATEGGGRYAKVLGSTRQYSAVLGAAVVGARRERRVRDCLRKRHKLGCLAELSLPHALD